MSNRLKELFFPRPFPGHVVLFAVFPVLSLYASNIRETDFGEALFPLLISAGAAFLLWVLLAVLLRDGRKAGFSAALLVLAFFSYGHLYSLLEGWDFPPLRHSRMITGMILVWGYVTYFIRLSRRDPRPLTKVLNLAAAALVGISVLRIGVYEITRDRFRRPERPPTRLSPSPESASPDIYFIVLDEYAHPRTMADYFGYDRSPFIDGLAERGFFIAGQSRTITPKTPQALAQVLNMEYLTPGWYWDGDGRQFRELPVTDPRNYVHPWGEKAFQKLGFNVVYEFLQSRGYRCIYFGSFAEIGKWARFAESSADAYYNYYLRSPSDPMTEFQAVLWPTTMLRLMYFRLVGGRYETYYRRGILDTLAHLKRIPEEAGPKFVFAHLMAPHEPFVFGPRGEPLDPADFKNYADRRIYLGQYIYISGRILELVDEWLSESSPPPIIIIQSDHGLRPTHPGVEVGPDEWKKILNAVYLPGPGREDLYDSISPVNTFRVIFNRYFSADFRLLEDRGKQEDT